MVALPSPSQVSGSLEDGHGMADLHIHSSLGDGMADIPQILDFVGEKTALDVIAITDHDDIKGSYLARELASQGGYRFQVVVGMEVTTLQGHLLALFLEDPVPSQRPVVETIEAIHAQGGLCIVPHPMSRLIHSIRQGTLDWLVGDGHGVQLDGIELANATLAGRLSRKKAAQLNRRRYRLAETGGSDAHFLPAIGKGYTIFKGHRIDELRGSILAGTTRAAGGAWVGLGEIGYSQLARQQFKCFAELTARLLSKVRLWL